MLSQKEKLSISVALINFCIVLFTFHCAISWHDLPDHSKEVAMLSMMILLPLVMVTTCVFIIKFIRDESTEYKEYQQSMATMYDFIDVRQLALLVKETVK